MASSMNKLLNSGLYVFFYGIVILIIVPISVKLFVEVMLALWPCNSLNYGCTLQSLAGFFVGIAFGGFTVPRIVHTVLQKPEKKKHI